MPNVLLANLFTPNVLFLEVDVLRGVGVRGISSGNGGSDNLLRADGESDSGAMPAGITGSCPVIANGGCLLCTESGGYLVVGRGWMPLSGMKCLDRWWPVAWAKHTSTAGRHVTKQLELQLG